MDIKYNKEDYEYEIKKINGDIHLIPKKQEYKSVLIFLHGFGTTPEDVVKIFENPENGNYIVPYDMKILLLCSPKLSITTLKGEMVNAWYDILDKNGNYNFGDVEKNAIKIFKIIKNEAKKLGDSSKILIGGFSQGANVALYTGYSFPIHIGGVIVCSGLLFKEIEIQKENEDTKIFVGHGKVDNVINIQANIDSFKRINNLNTYIENHYYDNMEHEITVNELIDIKKFIYKCLNNN